jgi:hypothetical protein
VTGFVRDDGPRAREVIHRLLHADRSRLTTDDS